MSSRFWVLVVAVAAFLGPVTALALASGSSSSAACPTVTAYTGTDASVAASRSESAVVAASCAAETDQAKSVRSAVASDSTVAVRGRVTVTDPSRAAPVGQTVAVSNLPTVQTVTDPGGARASDADASGLNSDLLLLCGVVLGCFAGAVLLMKVLP